MASFNFNLKRSNVNNKRPDPAFMSFGELNINYSNSSGGLFFKDSAGTVRKIGPAEVGPTAPNVNPAGSSGNALGEFWYDTSTSTLKVWDATQWVSITGGGGGGPTTRSYGRMWWNQNTTSTSINSSGVYYLMDSSSRSLDVNSSGFSLSNTYSGLIYTRSTQITVIATASGKFDGSNRRDYRFAIAKTSGVPSLPNDVISDSVTVQREDRAGQHFKSESFVTLNQGDLIYPVVRNDDNTDNVEITSISLLVREV